MLSPLAAPELAQKYPREMPEPPALSASERSRIENDQRTTENVIQFQDRKDSHART